jgi:hypothetical protein
MATRTVRFDEETEKVLEEVRAATGWPISEILKRGLAALRDVLRRKPTQLPYDIYRELDLGPGGYAVGASDNSRATVRATLERKHSR